MVPGTAHLPSNQKALNSNSSTTKKKKRRRINKCYEESSPTSIFLKNHFGSCVKMSFWRAKVTAERPGRKGL
jgi:hypothetical protein